MMWFLGAVSFVLLTAAVLFDGIEDNRSVGCGAAGCGGGGGGAF